VRACVHDGEGRVWDLRQGPQRGTPAPRALLAFETWLRIDERGTDHGSGKRTLGQGARHEQGLDVKNVSMAVYFASVLGAAAFNLPAVRTVAVIGAGGATAVNIASYRAKTRDKSPIFHAMGVTVNRAESTWY
jgi:hypothetical protein